MSGIVRVAGYEIEAGRAESVMKNILIGGTREGETLESIQVAGLGNGKIYVVGEYSEKGQPFGRAKKAAEK